MRVGLLEPYEAETTHSPSGGSIRSGAKAISARTSGVGQR